ncbi:MAG: hypothetical protein II802_01810 [Clostridia bacterium]|nr:hypothetical protein [Clostridia bacterium]
MPKRKNYDYGDDLYEDISSSSQPVEESKSFFEYADTYGNFIFRNISKIIKGIAFAVAAIIIIMFVVIAFLLIKLDSFFIVIGIGLGIVGIILAGIFLFLIYGLGHVISQNEEILQKMR